MKRVNDYPDLNWLRIEGRIILKIASQISQKTSSPRDKSHIYDGKPKLIQCPKQNSSAISPI